MNRGSSDLQFRLSCNMNARSLDNNRRGRHSGKGNPPTVFYTDHLTDSAAYVGMAEHNYWGLVDIDGGIRHECRGSNSEN